MWEGWKAGPSPVELSEDTTDMANTLTFKRLAGPSWAKNFLYMLSCNLKCIPNSKAPGAVFSNCPSPSTQQALSGRAFHSQDSLSQDEQETGKWLKHGQTQFSSWDKIWVRGQQKKWFYVLAAKICVFYYTSYMGILKWKLSILKLTHYLLNIHYELNTMLKSGTKINKTCLLPSRSSKSNDYLKLENLRGKLTSTLQGIKVCNIKHGVDFVVLLDSNTFIVHSLLLIYWHF